MILPLNPLYAKLFVANPNVVTGGEVKVVEDVDPVAVPSAEVARVVMVDAAPTEFLKDQLKLDL